MVEWISILSEGRVSHIIGDGKGKTYFNLRGNPLPPPMFWGNSLTEEFVVKLIFLLQLYSIISDLISSI